jgi:outer membrane protein assembly factor BamA
VGTSFAVLNAELRFPILNPSMGMPIGFPPIEGALFYDAAVAWTSQSQVALRARREGETVTGTRVPLRSLGASIRVNMLGLLILRFDYAKPLARPGTNAFWTISLGPTF